MNALQIEHLTKTYKDFKLDNVNLTLPCGCIMGLIGENGAGKSTTIKLILDMIHRDRGTVTILGRDNQDNLKLTKEDIGVVLDEVGIPQCLTAKQVGNIMRLTFQNWDDQAYTGLLTQLNVPSNKKFKELSRGMKMKLGIAVALSHHPKLLILDEATNGLDPVARDELLDLFHEFTRDEDHAILISSHIVSDLEKVCDYIAFLHQGKLLLCEEKDLLLEQYAVLHCTKEQLAALNPEAIKGIKENSYGVEALVVREKVPLGMHLSLVNIEELFLFLAKEAN